MRSVSVVIPCYNYGRFLPDALSSVLDHQHGVDIRVLIIDDASNDGSDKIVATLANSDSRVEVSAHTSNFGPNATFNEGLLDWASGDYSLLISADDILTPGALKRATDLLDSHPNIGFVHGHTLKFGEGARLPKPRTNVRGWSVWPGQVWLEQRFRVPRNLIATPAVVVRTSLQKSIGGYDLRLPHAGDMEMWMRLAANADVGYLRGVDQAYIRFHGSNMSMSFTPLMDLRQRKLAYETILDHYGNRMADATGLSDIVRRKLSREALWLAARAYDQGQTKQTPVHELVGFALDCWPEAVGLPLFRTLRLRQQIGPRAMPYLQPFVLSAFANKTCRWSRRRFYDTHGI